MYRNPIFTAHVSKKNQDSKNTFTPNNSLIKFRVFEFSRGSEESFADLFLNLSPVVVLGERATGGGVDLVVRIRLPGDCTVELADILVLNCSACGEVNGNYLMEGIRK